MNKPMGYHVIEPTASALLDKVRAGYTFLAFSTDFLFLGDSCRGELSRVREQLEASDGVDA